MSWQEDYLKPFVITTGDGLQYTFKWKEPEFSREYNEAQFHYINVPGTDVKRGKEKGRRLTLDLYMDGDDHLDRMRAFDQSGKDSRPWRINHPAYGTLLVQPVSLYVDNRVRNVSHMTIVVIETIGGGSIAGKPVAKDRIAADKIEIDQLQLASYSLTVVPTTADVREYKGDMDKLYAEGSKATSNKLDAETYFNAYTAAYSKLDDLMQEPEAAVRLAQRVINAPFLFQETVQRRIEVFTRQLVQLGTGIANLLTPGAKRRYETNAGGLVTAMAAGAVTNTAGSYKNRTDVVAVMDTLKASYTAYANNLDTLMSETGGDEDAYVPDTESQIKLNRLVVYTLNVLMEVALDGKVERSIVLDRDRAIIPLVYDLLGDDMDDTLLDEFLDTNNIGRGELFMLEKGRTVRYYV